MRRETRSELRARLSELKRFKKWIRAEEIQRPGWTKRHDIGWVDDRVAELEEQLKGATEDLFKSVIKSHEVICAVKKMDAKAAYGQDPGMYYTLAVCGEAGEMANKIVKALRNGNDPTAIRKAIMSELPDVIIYGAVLGHVMDLDVSKLVNDKVGVVIERAQSGYYGPPLPPAASGTPPQKRSIPAQKSGGRRRGRHK